MGWIRNRRPGNQGGIGNTLEELLGIEENNLPIPNAAEWELKTQRMSQTSLTTLFHMEPSPRAMKFVPKIFLRKYGWRHDKAGIKYSQAETSFRQTINALNRTDRGFGIQVDRESKKIMVSFDHSAVSERHERWLKSVGRRAGLQELDPQPYWGFDDIYHKAATKLLNCFYVKVQTKREAKEEYFHYEKIYMLEG